MLMLSKSFCLAWLAAPEIYGVRSILFKYYSTYLRSHIPRIKNVGMIVHPALSADAKRIGVFVPQIGTIFRNNQKVPVDNVVFNVVNMPDAP